MNEPASKDMPPNGNNDPGAAERQKALKAFQAEMDRRIAEADRGEGIDVEEAFRRIRERAQRRRREMG